MKPVSYMALVVCTVLLLNGCIPGAVIMQYTGLSEYSESDPPTYACVGDRDGIAN